jgi:hypothetical protein
MSMHVSTVNSIGRAISCTLNHHCKQFLCQGVSDQSEWLLEYAKINVILRACMYYEDWKLVLLTRALCSSLCLDYRDGFRLWFGELTISCGWIVIQLCKSHTKRFTRFTLSCAPQQAVGLSCACYLSILDKKGSTTLILHPYSFPLSKARLEEVFSTGKSSNAPNVGQGLQLGKKTKHFAINLSI